MLLEQLTNGRDQIAGGQAAAALARPFSGTGVQPYAQTRRIEAVQTLGTQCADQPGEDIAQPAGGHGRMTVLADRQATVGRRDQAAGALEYTHRRVLPGQAQGCRRAICLHMLGRNAQQPRRFAGVWGQYRIGGQRDGALGQLVQRIGVPHLRLVLAGRHRQQAAPPTGLAQAGPDHQHASSLGHWQELIGRGDIGHHHFRQARQRRRHVLAAGGQRDHAGPAAQGTLGAEQCRAAGAVVAADHQHTAVHALVRIHRPRRQGWQGGRGERHGGRWLAVHYVGYLRVWRHA